ncbi:MAG: hypothetical protein RIR26_407 [Pseudomonadota bacterium]
MYLNESSNSAELQTHLGSISFNTDPVDRPESRCAHAKANTAAERWNENVFVLKIGLKADFALVVGVRNAVANQACFLSEFTNA